jgi:hypothetical protein
MRCRAAQNLRRPSSLALGRFASVTQVGREGEPKQRTIVVQDQHAKSASQTDFDRKPSAFRNRMSKLVMRHNILCLLSQTLKQDVAGTCREDSHSAPPQRFDAREKARDLVTSSNRERHSSILDPAFIYGSPV